MNKISTRQLNWKTDFQFAKVALKYGAVDYILKPIDRNELNRALEQVRKKYSDRPEEKGIVRQKDTTEQIKDRIDREYAENLSLSSLAKEYYMNKERKNLIHPQIDKFLMATFTEVSKNGINKTLTNKNMKKLYEKYCIRMENIDEN